MNRQSCLRHAHPQSHTGPYGYLLLRRKLRHALPFRGHYLCLPLTQQYGPIRRFLGTRNFSSGSRQCQDAVKQRKASSSEEDSLHSQTSPVIKPRIRDRLREWQQEQSQQAEASAIAQRKAVQPDLLDDGSDRPDIQFHHNEEIDDLTADSYLEEFDRLSGQYEGATAPETSFRPGDILELPGGDGGKLELAVFLKNAQQCSVMYNVQGRICVAQVHQPHFVAPSQFTEAELNPIMACIPLSPFAEVRDVLKAYADAVPRHVGAHIIRKLLDFQKATDKSFRTYSGALNNIHSLIAHPTEPRLMSLEHIAATVVGVPASEASQFPLPLLCAVSHALIRDHFGFKIFNRSYAETRQLVVESKYSADAVQRVVGWTRNYQEEASLLSQRKPVPEKVRAEAMPMHAFVEKAQWLCRASQQIRIYAPGGSIIGTKPEYAKDPKVAEAMLRASFSDSDRDIIHFLTLYASAKSFFYHPSLAGMPAIIVRAIRVTSKTAQIDADEVHTLLVELGITQPFNDSVPWDHDLRQHDQTLENELSTIQEKIDAGTPVPQAANLIDSMTHLRKDWGDLPVFCIDSATTTEVDDGVSVEEIPESPGHVWLHAHVAHPSAFITPDHPVARCAQSRFSTNYLPEGKLAMLPAYMSQRFSVQPGSSVLTTSIRLDAEANILDYKIRPGTVHNVVTIHDTAVDALFGHTKPTSEMAQVISVNTSPTPSSDQDSNLSSEISIDAAHQRSLRRLLGISKALNARRPKGIVRNSIRQTTDVTNLPFNPFLSPDFPRIAALSHLPVPRRPSYALGQPNIVLKINPDYDSQSLRHSVPPIPSEVLVTEIMTLANTLIARYAADRHIPIPFHGTRRIVKGIETDMYAMRARLERMLRGKEPMERTFLRYMRVNLGTRTEAAKPIPHTVLGLPSYTKATSPLRRYLDLVTGWQIDAALREEHRLGRSLASAPSAANEGSSTDTTAGASAADDHSSNSASYLPLSYADMTSILARAKCTEHNHIRFNVTHEKHFVVQAFARALYLDPDSIKPASAASPTPGDPSSTSPFADPELFNPRERLFTAVVGSGGMARRQLVLEGLEVAADSEDQLGVEDGVAPTEGERWAVRVDRVRLGSKRVSVRLLRRLG